VSFIIDWLNEKIVPAIGGEADVKLGVEPAAKFGGFPPKVGSPGAVILGALLPEVPPLPAALPLVLVDTALLEAAGPPPPPEQAASHTAEKTNDIARFILTVPLP
jgi:hypothetical protein